MRQINNRLFESANKQAGIALLDSTIEFLIQNKMPKHIIHRRLKRLEISRVKSNEQKDFQSLAKAYEDMGSVLSTWFDSPEFLENDGSPAPITLKPGPRSIRRLLKESRSSLTKNNAIELFRKSPSVRFDSDDTIHALRRVFVLSEVDLMRAALVIPRYIETLLSNSVAYRSGTIKLFERQCSAERINSKSIGPILRNIKEQGTSFVDSIDGQIEAASGRRTKITGKTQLGLVVFAWTGPSKSSV